MSEGNGRADLPHLATSLQMEVDELFPIAETLQLLRLTELAEGDIHLTDAGRRFVHADVDERKRLFSQHLLNYVPLAGHIKRVLDAGAWGIVAPMVNTVAEAQLIARAAKHPPVGNRSFGGGR